MIMTVSNEVAADVSFYHNKLTEPLLTDWLSLEEIAIQFLSTFLGATIGSWQWVGMSDLITSWKFGNLFAILRVLWPWRFPRIFNVFFHRSMVCAVLRCREELSTTFRQNFHNIRTRPILTISVTSHFKIECFYWLHMVRLPEIRALVCEITLTPLVPRLNVSPTWYSSTLFQESWLFIVVTWVVPNILL